MFIPVTTHWRRALVRAAIAHAVPCAPTTATTRPAMLIEVPLAIAVQCAFVQALVMSASVTGWWGTSPIAFPCANAVATRVEYVCMPRRSSDASSWTKFLCRLVRFSQF